MEVSEKTVGKVCNIDYKSGYGEVVTYDDDDIYMFTIEDIISNEKINKGDYIVFRKEKVNDINKAFFVNKISKEELNTDKIKKYLKKE